MDFSLSTTLASRERVGRAGDCASATNNSFLVALRLRFMNERRTGTRFPSRSSPPTCLQPSSLCHRLTLVRLASALCLRHLLLSLFSVPPPLFSPALCPSLSEAERVWSPLIRTLRSSEQQSRPRLLVSSAD